MSCKLTFTCLAVGSKVQIFLTKCLSTYCEQRTKVMGAPASGSRVPSSPADRSQFMYILKQANPIYGVRSQDSGPPWHECVGDRLRERAQRGLWGCHWCSVP